MQGRITEQHLPQAEKCFPGICRFYDEMPVKPLTFLQLLWAFEKRTQAQPTRRKRSSRSSRRG